MITVAPSANIPVCSKTQPSLLVLLDRQMLALNLCGLKEHYFTGRFLREECWNDTAVCGCVQTSLVLCTGTLAFSYTTVVTELHQLSDRHIIRCTCGFMLGICCQSKSSLSAIGLGHRFLLHIGVAEFLPAVWNDTFQLPQI